MDDPDQSPLVSSSTAAAAEQDRWQPLQQPRFQYQFVRDPEEAEEEDDDEEEEEEVDDERLEVRERKPAAPTAVAAAPVAAPAPAPPLLDLGASGERPAPAPQPAWTSHPATPSPPASPPEEKPKEPPRSAPLPPPPAPPRPEEPPAIPPRSAPLPPKRDEPPAPARKGAASGSPDETLFALPVAFDPLMHSSADKGMDSQEQPGRVRSDGLEDFAAVPLDATASLPSLSPLSANPFKEYTALDTISDGLSTKGSYSHIETEVLKGTTKNARNPFLADDDDASNVPEVKPLGVVPPYPGSESFSLSQTKESIDSKGRSDTSKFSEYQEDSSPDSPVELFAKHDEDGSLEDRKYDIDDHGEKTVFMDNCSVKEDYVDFKPFEPTWVSNESGSLKTVARNLVDDKLESGVDKYDVDQAKILPVQKDFEKESESSNEDISFPSTPEAGKESPQAYITCTKFESAVAVEDNTAKSVEEEHASQNKTDEKKIAEMKAHFGTESSTAHIESASSQSQTAESDKEKNLLKISTDAASVAEGLTPDLVQEAYESELHDSVSPSLPYETKIDLVQTSESLQEPLNVAVQLCPSFEGSSEATPSPVLPDIVMEAPLNASTVGVSGPTVPLESSLLETFTSAADVYENVMQKSEKPPSYQEAMNVPATQAQVTKAETAAEEYDYKNGTALEDLETSYISIACDLVKETKISNESPPPAFTDYSKTVLTECVSQPVPEYSEHLEKLSPPAGKSDFFSNRPELDLAQKEREVAKEKPLETTAKMVTEESHVEKREDLPSSLSKPYLESFQPPLEFSKDVPAAWSLEVEAADLSKKEKTPQLLMKELDTYSDDFLISKEPRLGDQGVPSAESSPESDDFPVVSYQAAKSVMGTTQKEALKGNESRESSDAIKTELRQSLYQEAAQDLSLKDVHVKDGERELVVEKPFEKLEGKVSEGIKESLSPADITPSPTEIKVVSVAKEAERGDASIKEKEKSPPIFSSQLNKPSVVDLLYWRDVKKTGVVFGASLFLLLSLTVFSIVSVVAYIALGLLSVTISFRIYKGVIQAIQKSDEGHPFRAYLDKDVAVSEELVQKYSHVVLGHFNNTVKELRRLFLVDDLVDSLKFAVLMWVFTYVGALFNGLTLMILAVISLFSIPVIYEKHQVQIDHYLGLVNKNVKDAVTKIQDKIPGLKRKTE
ncbi:reticulon-4 isoform X1 [Eublepharis macularius]|uniref:Reticulon n=1 Tax=Eublepharis macularius TaxID=481883 RepID=A0AA97JP15_EUBMA|nr:reticulon-4 isoform X1 [Eublepharis macularius]